MDDARGKESLSEDVDEKGLRESPSDASTRAARYEANSSERR